MPRVFETKTGAGLAGGATIETEPEQLWLFPGGIDLAELRRERATLAASTRAPATERAYACDWSDWSAWCEGVGRASLPASADTLGLYLVHLARIGRAVSTIERRAAAVASRHLEVGCASPVGEEVREVLGGIRRRLGTAARRAKTPVSIEQLRAMLAAPPQVVGAFGIREAAAPSMIARERSILLLGFAGGLRRSEVAGLELADVTIEREGVVVRLRWSKTDQEGAGRELGIHRGRHETTCPVAALMEWIRERGPWPGPLYCRVSAAGAIVREGLTGEAIAGVVRRAANRAGLDGARFAGHSLRSGFATSAAGNGATDRSIQDRTGHRSSAMVSRYVRHGSLFALDPLRGAL